MNEIVIEMFDYRDDTSMMRFSFKYNGKMHDGILYRDGFVVVKKRNSEKPNVFESIHDITLYKMIDNCEGFDWIDGVCFSCGIDSSFWQTGKCFEGKCRVCGSSWDGILPAFERES